MAGIQAMPSKKRTLWFVGLGSAVLMLLGTFLPWATVTSVFGNVSISGVQGDGVIVLLLALIGGAALAIHVLAKGEWTRFMPWVALGAGALGLLISLIGLINVGSVGGDAYASAGIGFGLILTFIASAGLAVASFLYQRERG
ncbi:MAG TPA: hypothetical protein GX743_00690 [Actinomycetales bacterium]|nr:hypothetical protein [Actinomycetales bacterium]